MTKPEKSERTHYYKLETGKTAIVAAPAVDIVVRAVRAAHIAVGFEWMQPVGDCLCLVPLEICKDRVCNCANTHSGYLCYRVPVGMTVGHTEIELPLWLSIGLPQSRQSQL
jgi:hypothetical protein